MIIYGTDPNALRPDPTGTAALRARLGIAAETPVVLCVGRMVHKKGFDVLIQALAEPVAAGAQARRSHGRRRRRIGGLGSSWQWT